MADSPLRSLPSIHALLDRPELSGLAERHGRSTVASAARSVLGRARADFLRGEAAGYTAESLVDSIAKEVVSDRPRTRRVINATGILLHTGLGRAPLASEAVEAVADVASAYCNLEFDLESGERGGRGEGAVDLLKRLTGAEAALIVNNNAGATILALRALARGREVVVSRGQLVEIGGSFRLPEIFEVSGARLREVGTTNKTRIGDYEAAIGPDTAALMRVHPSNFRIVGFTEAVGIAELVILGRRRGLATIDDVGSGALDREKPPGVSGEPTVAEGLRAGADLVLFSGDKLLGGPQCGLMVGGVATVSRLARDPLMRALRCDKLTLAAIEATLRLALDPTLGRRRIPLWRFLTNDLDDLRERAARLVDRLRLDGGPSFESVEGYAFLGGGSVPVEPIPSVAVRLGPPWPAGLSEAAIARSLRTGDPCVVPRVQGGAVWLDLRAVEPDEDDALSQAVALSLGGGYPGGPFRSLTT